MRVTQREIRSIAAVGDLHYDGSEGEALTRLVMGVAGRADVLAICGDLTTQGRPGQMRGVAEALLQLELPVVCVFGNHDYESDTVEENQRILAESGVHVLDGGTVNFGRVGFAGVKGFPGGFGRGALGAFGEPQIKGFVQAAIDEELKLENALRNLDSEVKVVLLHYAPITGTVEGEPREIYPYLGSSRLLPPLESLGADVVLHGHAHSGTHRATTPAGIPVFNVSLPVLRAEGTSTFFWSPPDAGREAAEAD